MYRIICYTNGTEYPLLDLRDEQYVLIEPVLKLGVNSAGSLIFYMTTKHPNYGCIIKLVSKIKVFKVNADGSLKWLFTGRSLTDEKDFYNTGKIECEGILAYLIDSVVRPYDFKGSPSDYFKQLIASHNSQVEEDKQFILGAVDIIDSDNNNYIPRSNAMYPTTYDEITEKIVSSLSCYIYVTEENDKQYINCTMTINTVNTQAIRFGDNLIDLSRHNSAESIKTVIVPLGAQDENGNFLTIASVNNGIDYVEDEEAVATYGRIVGIINFEDVTLPANLLRKGQAYLKSVLNPSSTITANVVDLNMTDSEIEMLEIGYADVISDPHGINKQMLLSSMELSLLNPSNNVYTLGVNLSDLSTSMYAVNRATANLSQQVQVVKSSTTTKINAAVDNATNLITGTNGGYVFLDSDEEGHPWRILIMDNADKEKAKNVIQLNKNGLGFSTKGINGPYANAWTIDGNLVADFITAGTMYADRIQGGTLTMGGIDNQSGVIKIIDGNGTVIGTWDMNGLTVSKGSIVGGDIQGGTIKGATIEGNTISGGTVSGSEITGGTINGTNIEGNNISGGTVKGSEISGGTVSGTKITGGTIEGTIISGSTISSGDLQEKIIIEDGKIMSQDNRGAYITLYDASYQYDILMNSSGIAFKCGNIYVGDKNGTTIKSAISKSVKVVTDVSLNDDKTVKSITTKTLEFTKGILTSVS